MTRHHHILASQHRFAMQCYVAHIEVLFPTLNTHDQLVLAEVVASAYSKRPHLENSGAAVVMLFKHTQDRSLAVRIARSFDCLHSLLLTAFLEHKYAIVIGTFTAQHLFDSVTDSEFKRVKLLHP